MIFALVDSDVDGSPLVTMTCDLTKGSESRPKLRVKFVLDDSVSRYRLICGRE